LASWATRTRAARSRQGAAKDVTLFDDREKRDGVMVRNLNGTMPRVNEVTSRMRGRLNTDSGILAGRIR
jgi:hypothetical protein